MNKQRTSSFLLLLTSLIWGTAFVAQGAVSDVLGAFTFTAVRTFVGAAIMIPVWLIMNRVQPQEAQRTATKEGRKTTILAGVICGIFMFLGSGLQQVGITEYMNLYGTTAVGKAGFITALYVIFVPILGLFIKKRPSFKVWVSVIIALAGLYLLCVKEGFTIDIPDVYLLLCALAFAFYILFVDHFAPRINIYLFSAIQLAVCGAISSVATAAFETVVWSDVLASWFPILYTGIFSSAIAYTLEAVAQKNVNPAVASLLFCLEAVFAALAGWLILNETMTGMEVLGCVLMFAAVLLAQLPNRKNRTTCQ